MATQTIVFGYRFPSIPEHCDEFQTHLAVDPNDQPIKYLRGITIAEIDKHWHSHSEAYWSLVIRSGINHCVECDKGAIRIVQHPWTQFKAANPTVGALVTPVCEDACVRKAHSSLSGRLGRRTCERAWRERQTESQCARQTRR